MGQALLRELLNFGLNRVSVSFNFLVINIFGGSFTELRKLVFFFASRARVIPFGQCLLRELSCYPKLRMSLLLQCPNLARRIDGDRKGEQIRAMRAIAKSGKVNFGSNHVLAAVDVFLSVVAVVVASVVLVLCVPVICFFGSCLNVT